MSAAVRAASGDVAAGDAGLRDTEASILEIVVGAYADLLYAQQAVAVARANIELLDHQVAEARSRFTLGQATQTDVAQLEAQRASAGATLAETEGTVAVVTATYRATVGHMPDALDQAPTPPSLLPATIDAARQWAVEGNPVVHQQQRIAEADAARIDQQRAERNPSIDLGATYGYAAGLVSRAIPTPPSAA